MLNGYKVLTEIYIAQKTGMIKEGKRVFIGRLISNEKAVEWVDVDTYTIVDRPSGSFFDAYSNVNLAVMGKAWRALHDGDPKYASAIAKYVRVFGRCTPSDKVAVITTFLERV
jgi:cation-transporting ATPase 13A3/4/5